MKKLLFKFLKKENQKNGGYILVLSVMMISILFVLVIGMFFNFTSYTALTTTAINREKAKMLALGGLKIAMGKLAIPAPAKKEETPKQPTFAAKPGTPPPAVDKTKEQLKNDIIFLKRILPSINRWDTINLKQEVDGIDGRIRICISSEDGKFNINKLYDFKNHKLIGEGPIQQQAKMIFEDIDKKLRQFTNKDLISPMLNYLKKRKCPLNDVTELLEVPEIAQYFADKIFYEPPKSEKEKRSLYLTDLFTIWTNVPAMQPWLFSDSVCTLLGLKRVEFGDTQQRIQLVDQWLKNFKNDLFPNSWDQKNWDLILKPMHNKDFKSISKFIPYLFEPKFASNVFSVVSYGTVGEVTQRIFAIVEMQKVGNNEFKFNLKKLYWI